MVPVLFSEYLPQSIISDVILLSWDTHLGCGNERKQEAGTSCHELDTELWGTVPESFIEGLLSGWAFNKTAR